MEEEEMAGTDEDKSSKTYSENNQEDNKDGEIKMEASNVPSSSRQDVIETVSGCDPGYEGEESDDGVKEGDWITYVGEIDPDAPSNYTNPERRKIFKRERKIRERENIEMKAQIEVKRRESRERKREKRAAKRRTLEEELMSDTDGKMEEKLHEYSRQKRSKLMKRYMSEEMDHRDSYEYYHGYHGYHRSRSMDNYRWGGGRYMDHRAFSHHMWEYLEMMEYHRRDDKLSPSDKRRLIERQVMMIIDDESDSESSDNSEVEYLEIQIHRNKCLNKKCMDMVEFNTLRDTFNKKVLLGDAHSLGRYSELHPELLEDPRFVNGMLYQATSSKSLSCLRFLLRNGGRSSRASPYTDDNGKTPLHIACEKNLYECVQTLVNHKARTEKRDNDGNTPLLTAMHNGASEMIVECLLSRAKIKLIEHINKQGQGLLTCHGPWKPDRNNGENEQRNNPKAIAVLLKKAKELGELDALLSYVSPETRLPPLMEAMNARNLDNMKVMIENGANVNTRLDSELYTSQTLCHYAAKKRFSSGLQMLLDGGAIPDAKDSEGTTVLQYLLQTYFSSHTYDYELIQCIDILAENGADVNAPLNDTNDTLIHVATQLGLETGIMEIAIKLIKAGANPLVFNKNGVTPLSLVKRGVHGFPENAFAPLKDALEEVACSVKSLSECCKWKIATSMGGCGPIRHTAKLLPLPKHLINYVLERDERRKSYFEDPSETETETKSQTSNDSCTNND